MKRQKKLLAIVAMVVVLIFAFGINVTFAGGWLGFSIVKDLVVEGLKSASEKIGEEKRNSQPQFATMGTKDKERLEKRFKEITGIKLELGKLATELRFTEIIVVVFEAKVNGGDGAYFMANKQNILAGEVYYEPSDMPVFKKFLEMNELQKKMHVHADFLKYAKLDLGPVESPSPPKTSAVTPDDQR